MVAGTVFKVVSAAAAAANLRKRGRAPACTPKSIPGFSKLWVESPRCPLSCRPPPLACSCALHQAALKARFEEHARGVICMRRFHARAALACSARLCVVLFALATCAEAVRPRACSEAPTHCFTSPHTTPSVRIYNVQQPAADGRVCSDDSRDLLNLPLQVSKHNTVHWAAHERCR